MIKKLTDLNVLEQGTFLNDEVAYNLIHLICENEQATRLTTTDNKLIYAQSPGNNAWLWLAAETSAYERIFMLQDLITAVKNTDLPGVTAAPALAAQFAELFAAAAGTSTVLNMGMEAYHCPIVRKPSGVDGKLRLTDDSDTAVIAEFLAGFSEGAFGVPTTIELMLPHARNIIAKGQLYLWIVQDQPVSMANIAHRSPRHARINEVYTPPAERKKGYASAIVAQLCALLQQEDRTPMLYADLKNPDSNKVYRNIGFVPCGQIADIKFK